MSDCLFCKIGAKQVPARIVYEDDQIYAFEDIQPQAPVHILISPRKHMVSLDDATEQDAALLAHMLLVAAKIAREQKLQDGYRTVFNTGRGAGQTVFHLHLHMLGGRTFRWPPG
jgi:diadenosine tetraphosphate (Ap4A) HIT family hydrolase